MLVATLEGWQGFMIWCNDDDNENRMVCRDKTDRKEKNPKKKRNPD